MISFRIPLEEDLVIRGEIHANGAVEQSQPVLLFCHGFKGFKDWGSFPYAAEALAKHGIITIRFNFSCNGVGESRDEFDELEKFAVNTYAREIADLNVLVNWLNGPDAPLPANADREQLFVLGHSKGGGDAILFGAQHPQVKGIVTWNGIADVNLFDARLRAEIAEHGTGYIANARTGQQMPIRKVVIDDVDAHKDEYDLLAKVSNMEKPLMIIQGDRDFERMVKGAQRLHQAARNSELHWIREGDHTWNTRHPFAGTTPQLEEAIQTTASFIQRNARQS
ncbi:alpha/beta hydrolase [Brevibacillus migulae]|uniref:alpha/beta hydrolase n=1 Tax=Brevibacillus migulae TaxID=1644114 RepID=UPI00106E182C|nr:alpha/beta hydrolase [Brevibacillus migulae]